MVATRGESESQWRLRRLVAPLSLLSLVAFGLWITRPAEISEDATPSLALTPAPVVSIRLAETETPRAAEPEAIARQVKLSRGDTFIGALTGAGIARDEAHRILAAIRPHFNPRHLQIGQDIELVFATEDGTEHLRELAFDNGVARRIHARSDSDGGWTGDLVEVPLTRATYRTGGDIPDSLYLAAARQDVPAALIADLIRVFSYDVDFQREIREGDSFELYYERFVTPDGGAAKNGNILFAKLTLRGKEIALYRYGEGDDADYFHADGRSVRKALLRTPVDGARLSSGFGSRKHPILGYTKMHKGVDFAAPRGTPIMAAGDGVVERASPYGGYGNYVRIRHNDEYSTAYAHMNGFAKGIRAGVRVKQGQIIGYVGTTGRSTGPHLHYEVLAKQGHINPLSVKLPTGRVLKGTELAAFENFRGNLDREIAAIPLPYDVALADSED